MRSTLSRYSDTEVLRAARRLEWRQRRLEMERGKLKSTPFGDQRARHWNEFKVLTGLFGAVLRFLGAYDRGVQNAHDIQMNRQELWFNELPKEFDGFQILQLTDLHVDFLPETTRIARRLITGIEVDLCVLTGDYRRRVRGPFDHIMPAIEELVSHVATRHGIYAVLGNHDCAAMAEAFEGLGISVLLNETRTIQRGEARLHFTGTDDVHYYYTDAAREALLQAPDGFKVALIHSAELADIAAESGFNLYLAGHTHGGQISLPGGQPIITHMSRFRGYANGLWQHGSMRGYTSYGVGVSGLPVRFNTRGEVALLTLRSGKPPPSSCGRKGSE